MDEFQTFTKGLTSPATTHFAIQPDDNSDLPILPRVIFCQTEGTIVITNGACDIGLGNVLGSGGPLFF